MNTNTHASLILTYKQNSYEESRLILPVQKEDGTRIGFLACLDRTVANDLKIISLMTSWRQYYMQYFLTQFEASNERTKAWINNIVLPSNDRLMFLIHKEDGGLVGNSGVCNIGDGYCELDNLIRGIKGGDPRLIYYCELALLNWLYRDLKMNYVNLHVFSNNLPTIRLHKSVGFQIQRSHSLSKTEKQGITSYLLDSSEGSTTDFTYHEMGLSQKQFFSQHSWLEELI